MSGKRPVSTSVRLVNAQRQMRLPMTRLARLARTAARRLRLRVPGVIEITFLSAAAMRRMNRRFKGHDRVTDVLSFRYVPGTGGSPVGTRRALPAGGGAVGEVLIAPSQAKAYARLAGLDATEELGRYVVHGLLHWLGYDDRTAGEKALMRKREDRLLRSGGFEPCPGTRRG